VSAKRSWHFGRSTLTLFADVANALDRHNVAGIDYDVHTEPGFTTFTPDKASLLPIVPSIGVSLTF
jgi:hypothetical protein